MEVTFPGFHKDVLDVARYSISGLQEEPWNDTVFKTKYLDEALKLVAQHDITNTAVIKGSISCFWGVYTGALTPGSASTWFGICCDILTASELFKDFNIGPQKTTITNPPSTGNTWSIETITQKKNCRGHAYTEDQQDLLKLVLDNAGGSDQAARQQSINFTLAHVLYLMRTQRKGFDEYVNAWEANGLKIISKLMGLEARYQVILPTEKMSDWSASLYGTASVYSCQFLSILIALILNPPADHSFASAPAAILRACCLTSLEKVGLGLYGWMMRAEQAVGRPIEEILAYLWFDATEKSITTISDFFVELKANIQNQRTYGYARCFGDQYLIRISSRKHQLLTYMLGLLCDIPNYEDLPSVVLPVPQRAAPRRLIELLKAEFSSLKNLTGKSAQAQSLLAKAGIDDHDDFKWE